MHTWHSVPCGSHCNDVAVGRARLHEAIVVALVAHVIAAAETRHVGQDFRVLGGEPEHLRDDLRRPRQRVARAERQRRQVRLLVRPERLGGLAPSPTATWIGPEERRADARRTADAACPRP